MPASFAIKSVVNLKTSRQARVFLDALPTGSLTWGISRLPSPAGAIAPVAVAAVDARTFTLTFPFAALWYIWATDAGGQVDLPGAAWIGVSDDPLLDQSAQAVTQILVDNLPGLNAALGAYMPGQTVKQVVYGTALDVRDFPAIVVTKPTIVDEYMGIPFLRTLTIGLEIHLYTLHQDKGTILQQSTRFLGRVMEILNQPDYSAIAVGDQFLSVCHASGGNSDEIEVEAGAWSTLGSLMWSGKADVMDLPATFG